MSLPAQDIPAPPGRHSLKLLAVPIIGFIICSNIANAVWPRLQETNPLLLISLSSINRYLLLVSDQLDAFSYYAVASARLFAPAILLFLLGRWYGERALVWLETRSAEYGPWLRKGQALFGRFGFVLVFVFRNNVVMLLAGASRMRVSVFVALSVSGIFARLYLLRVLGDRFSDPISGVRDFVSDYQLPLIILSVAVVGLTMRRNLAPGGQIDNLRHIDEHLGDADPEGGAGDLADDQR